MMHHGPGGLAKHLFNKRKGDSVARHRPLATALVLKSSVIYVDDEPPFLAVWFARSLARLSGGGTEKCSVLHLLFPSVQFRPVTFQRINALCTPRLSHLISPVVPDGMCFAVICCALALCESPTALPRWRANVAVAELHFVRSRYFEGCFRLSCLCWLPRLRL